MPDYFLETIKKSQVIDFLNGGCAIPISRLTHRHNTIDNTYLLLPGRPAVYFFAQKPALQASARFVQIF
jgi:hypothetical protein